MTKQILRTLLQRDQAQEYCVECLKDGNSLAQELLKVISFDSGSFFAITSTTADPSKLNDFHHGGLLPLNSLDKVIFRNIEYSARRQSTSVEEYAQYLYNCLAKNRKWWCIVEDITRTKSDLNTSEMKAKAVYFGEEVYYVLRGDVFSVEVGIRVIRYANAMWRYMNIITEEPILSNEQNLTLDMVHNIASKTIYLAVGAYDMEGYVCWERSLL